jgi:hypothetical protein
LRCCRRSWLVVMLACQAILRLYVTFQHIHTLATPCQLVGGDDDGSMDGAAGAHSMDDDHTSNIAGSRPSCADALSTLLFSHRPGACCTCSQYISIYTA